MMNRLTPEKDQKIEHNIIKYVRNFLEKKK